MGDQSIDSSHYEALLKGGEQVTPVLEEMDKLLEDDNKMKHLRRWHYGSAVGRTGSDWEES